MTNHIPTIQDLLRRLKRELAAIFQKAICIASDETLPLEDREAAARTARNARLCVGRPPAP